MRLDVKSYCSAVGIAAFAMGLVVDSASASTILPIGIYANADGASLAGLSVTVNVTDGGSFAMFTVQNGSVGLNSGAVVTSIYFELTAFSSTFLGAGSLVTPFDPGVDYSPGASPGSPAPGMLPSWGGNKFTARPDSPPPVNGVNSGEEVSFRFNYLGGLDYAMLSNTLLANPDAFRVAMHIQNVGADGDSIWGTTVPAPGAVALLGLAGVVAGRRRR